MTQTNILKKIDGVRDRMLKVAELPFVFGDWDTDTVRLDFDDTPLEEVLLWCYRATLFFKLEGFIVLQSSVKNYVVKQNGKFFYRYRKGSYLVVFNRPVDWSKNVHVMNWVSLESGNENLQRYVRMQCIKETSTVRISAKGKKPIPKIVFHYGFQDKQIRKFLETRKLLLSFLRAEAHSRRQRVKHRKLQDSNPYRTIFQNNPYGMKWPD